MSASSGEASKWQVHSHSCELLVPPSQVPSACPPTAAAHCAPAPMSPAAINDAFPEEKCL